MTWLSNLPSLRTRFRKPADADGITSEARERIRLLVVEAAQRDAEELRRVWASVGPYPAAAIGYLDPVQRVILHQPCDRNPCPHTQWHQRINQNAVYAPGHCRCGSRWVCDLAGPLNGGSARWS